MAKRSKDKPRRPKKKVFLFLVEGGSEFMALEAAFTKLIRGYDEEITVLFCHRVLPGGKESRDITADDYVNPRNIEAVMSKTYIEPELDRSRLYPKDLSEIIHIIDTDGVYIPDDKVISIPPVPQRKDTLYFDDHIEAVHRDVIVDRNRRKRENIDCLVNMTEVKAVTKKIPYSVYYFSSNLDHVLHHDANLPSNRKCAMAAEYALGAESDRNIFIGSMCNDEVCPRKDYKGSWDFIREDLRSLQRHTNIGILVNRILDLIRESENAAEDPAD